MTGGNVEDSLEGRHWRLHNWVRSCCSGPSMEWTYLSQSELGVHPPCSHSIQYVPYLNVYETMWNQLFTGLYSSQGCVPQEGKDGICFFIAVPLLHLEYTSEFMAETAKSCYLSLLISYHTHLLFSLMQLQRLSFSSIWQVLSFLSFFALHCEPPLHPWIFLVPFPLSVLRNFISSKRFSRKPNLNTLSLLSLFFTLPVLSCFSVCLFNIYVSY